MKNKQFKPLLAPNDEINLNDISYPILASTKLDGIRVIFYKGKILTRSLKALPNKQLNQKFEPLRQYSEDYNLILDGEIYSHELTFQDIISFCMTQDFEDKKSIKKYGEVKQLPNSLKFYCFDCVINDEFDKPFIKRCIDIVPIAKRFESLMFLVDQMKVRNNDEVENYFNIVLDHNYEGLILRDIEGSYKCGRGTVKERIIYKVKPFRTFDAEIIDVIQSTEVNKDAEKKTNELGRSVTSKKKDDRHLIDKASAFLVNYCAECNDTKKVLNGSEYCTCPFCKKLKVTLAMTDEEKEEVWKNKESYLGKWIEYKGMLVGAKDVPRHPVMIRFRKDKE